LPFLSTKHSLKAVVALQRDDNKESNDTILSRN
jgi:hypothetical protein